MREDGCDKGAHQSYLGTEKLASVFQNWFQPLVYAAVAFAILESISGLEPLSVITEPRYLRPVTISSFCPFTLISCVDTTGVVCHQLGLLGTNLHAVGCGGFVETPTSSSSLAKLLMSSAK